MAQLENLTFRCLAQFKTKLYDCDWALSEPLWLKVYKWRLTSPPCPFIKTNWLYNMQSNYNQILTAQLLIAPTTLNIDLYFNARYQLSQLLI